MILLTVGSTNIPFDRLIRAIDIAKAEGYIEDEIFGQIGCSRYTPKYFSYERFINKANFDKQFSESNFIIGHAGMGTIMMSLEMKKPLLISPRRKEYHEHVNEHQLHTAQKFEQMKHVIAIYELDDSSKIAKKIEEAISFKPLPREKMANDLARDLTSFMNSLD